ncbi:MAG: pyridoxamine 5'-phosphate oxidase family protein [Chlamydiia bacterium]|nr:pyridoxamine 5'-phosphate oxidase family protein [Chlamydiia bacterium]
MIRVMKYLLLALFSFSLFAKEVHPIAKVNQWCKEEKEMTEGRHFIFGALASVSSDGRPHTRMMEISHFDKESGALFFAHKHSQKVEHFLFNPYASLTVYLPKTHRQFTLDGKVTEVSRSDAEKSWKKMPRYMQLTFLASNHKDPLASEEVLQQRKEALEKEFPKEIPLPDVFIGYRLKPDHMTFYQINHRSFPKKEVATCDKKNWITAQVEP